MKRPSSRHSFDRPDRSTITPKPSPASSLGSSCSWAREVLLVSGMQPVAWGGVSSSRRQKEELVALVVLLRGINVGGHRTLRPITLAAQLKHFDAVNIGAAGTFVIRKSVTQAELRADLARRLPFDAQIMICEGREIVRLMSRNHFADQPVRPDIVRFVSVLSERPHPAPSMPICFPSSGKWLLKILARDNRFIFGVYRRHMKVVSYLGRLDRIFGVPAT